MKKKYEYNKIRINMWIDRELANKFKSVCSYEGKTMTEIISSFMSEYVKKHNEKIGQQRFFDSF